jgi:cysteine synthase
MDAAAIADLAPMELHKLVQHLGNTPMEPIYLVIGGIARKIHLKLESENPTGSVKDRTGYSLIQTLEAQGRLNERSIVIESTSGNLGTALSFFCKLKGCRFVAVIDPKTTQENRAKIQALGGQIEMVDQPDENGGYLLSRLRRVRDRLHRRNAGRYRALFPGSQSDHLHHRRRRSWIGRFWHSSCSPKINGHWFIQAIQFYHQRSLRCAHARAG